MHELGAGQCTPPAKHASRWLRLESMFNFSRFHDSDMNDSREVRITVSRKMNFPKTELKGAHNQKVRLF